MVRASRNRTSDRKETFAKWLNTRERPWPSTKPCLRSGTVAAELKSSRTPFKPPISPICTSTAERLLSVGPEWPRRTRCAIKSSGLGLNINPYEPHLGSTQRLT